MCPNLNRRRLVILKRIPTLHPEIGSEFPVAHFRAVVIHAVGTLLVECPATPAPPAVKLELVRPVFAGDLDLLGDEDALQRVRQYRPEHRYRRAYAGDVHLEGGEQDADGRVPTWIEGWKCGGLVFGQSCETPDGDEDHAMSSQFVSKLQEGTI